MLATMGTADKIAMLHGVGKCSQPTLLLLALAVYQRASLFLSLSLTSLPPSLSRALSFEGPKVVPGGVGYVPPNDKLGIPPLILANGPQGYGPWTGDKGNATTW